MHYFFFLFLGQNAWQKQLNEERTYFGSQSKDTARQGNGGMTAKAVLAVG